MSKDIMTVGVIVAVGAMLFGLALFFLDGGAQSYDIEMEYEDWENYSAEALGVDGPIELVDGKIHAIGTGTAKIYNADGSKTTVKITPAHATLVLMDGQSNAAYYKWSDDRIPGAEDIAVAIAPEQGKAFYFGWPDRMPTDRTDDVSGCEIYDMIDDSGALRVADKGPAFCKVYTETTGKKAIWVSLGVPGVRLTYWNQPNGLVWQYNVYVMQTFNGLLKDTDFVIDSTIVLWLQGESDYLHDTGYSNYITRWTSLHDAAPEAWGHDIDAWYLLQGRTADFGWVNDAYVELAATIDDVYLATHASLQDSYSIANGLMMPDDLHYSQLGDNALATAAARYIVGSQDIAPIYLMQAENSGSVGATITAPKNSRCYRTDGSYILAKTTWNSTPDSSEAGTFVINGTAANITSAELLDNAPGPLLIVTVEE